MTRAHTDPGEVQGQQASFLDECWAQAAPKGLGQLGGDWCSKLSKAKAAPVARELTRAPWGNLSSESGKGYSLLPNENAEGRCVSASPSAEGPPARPDSGVPIASAKRDTLDIGRWSSDALYQFEERLGMAEGLGLDIAPGSPSWERAVFEANSVDDRCGVDAQMPSGVGAPPVVVVAIRPEPCVGAS